MPTNPRFYVLKYRTGADVIAIMDREQDEKIAVATDEATADVIVASLNTSDSRTETAREVDDWIEFARRGLAAQQSTDQIVEAWEREQSERHEMTLTEPARVLGEQIDDLRRQSAPEDDAGE